MTPEAITALHASIAHWNENIAAETPGLVRVGADKCALCMLVFHKDCRGCPIMGKTLRIGCAGSPYWGALNALRDWRDNPDSPLARDAWRKHATAMRDFLVGLLP